jgi:hypothetical protein
MTGTFVTYGGRRVDIGPASVRLLRAIVSEFRTAVLFDSIEAVAAADRARAVGLLRRAASQVQVARVMRYVGKLITEPGGNAKRIAEQRLPADAAEPRR